MNPPGAVVAPNMNEDDKIKPHVSNIILGDWLVVYSWPPLPTIAAYPPAISLEEPSKLEAVLFGCRCREEIADKLHPVKLVIAGRGEVQACELIGDEAQVNEALDRTTCECRTVPLGDKFAALPLNDSIVLHYQRKPNYVYEPGISNHCQLLFNYVPSSQDIEEAVKGLDIYQRSGNVTFMIKKE